MKDLGNKGKKTLQTPNLHFHKALLHPTHGGFCATTKEIKLEPKLEELMLLNRQTDNINVFLSSSDMKADR